MHKSLKIKYYPNELQLKHTFTVASYSRTVTPDVLVEIEYDGVIGYGEASMPPYLSETTDSVLAFLSLVHLESFSSPFLVEDILSYVDRIKSGNTAAKASIDIALHDLIGKLLQTPLYSLFGLNPDKTPYTTYTIGIDTPTIVQKKTLEVENKFHILKVKLGGENDEQIIQAIRNVSQLPLTIDANQGWKDKHLALEKIQWLKEQNVVMVEQPMPKEQLDDIAWVTQHSPLPIFADESVQRLKDIPKIQGAFSGINIKLMKCTGLREAWKMMNVARLAGMQVMIGCMTETSCAVSAAAQLSPFVDFADLDGNLLISNDPFEGVKVIDGKIALNHLPGIGIIPLKN